MSERIFSNTLSLDFWSCKGMMSSSPDSDDDEEGVDELVDANGDDSEEDDVDEQAVDEPVELHDDDEFIDSDSE